MRIWVTGIGDPVLASALDRLEAKHDVVVSEGIDLRDPEAVKPFVSGVEVVVHSCAAIKDGPDEDVLDREVRGAYVVLEAACDKKAKRAVLVSSLAFFDEYDETYAIDEAWRPRPEADAKSLVPLLVERTFREFSRSRPVETICLRLGQIDQPKGTPTELAVDAIEGALTLRMDPEGYRSVLYHVCEGERFSSGSARKALSLGGNS